MAKRSPELSQLDPLHPLIRRLLRAVQLYEIAVIESPVGFSPEHFAGIRAARLSHVSDLLVLVCAHIRRAVPRVEHDEQAQMLITADDGTAIGRLRRPATLPDCLLPMIESAMDRLLTGDDGKEGDSEAASECAPETAGVLS